MTLLFIRSLLSVIFGVAGVAKLLDPHGARQSMREFGVPSGLAAPIAMLLPLAELACAIALLTGAFAWHGAVAASGLLTLFVAGMVINLARGRTPDCHCFGKLHSEPVGWPTVLRNLVLVALALSIVAQGVGNTGPGLATWFFQLPAVSAIVVALVIGFGILTTVVLTMLVQLLAQNGRLMVRVEALEAIVSGRAEPSAPAAGLASGSQAPGFHLDGLDGIPVSLEALNALGKPIVLVFSEPGCSACDALLPEVARWQREHADTLLIVPIVGGNVDANRRTAAEHQLRDVLVQDNREVADAYQVQGTPSAVVVMSGMIASRLAAGAAEIHNLVFEHSLPRAVKRGERAPSLELRDLHDRPLNISATAGKRRVLLFWNPTCGFCKDMLRDIKSWERTRSRMAPELVIVTAGSAEANRDQGFKSRVVLNPIFGAGQVFGGTGTPSAVMLDGEGVVVSDVVVGAPDVLEMLKTGKERGVAA